MGKPDLRLAEEVRIERRFRGTQALRQPARSGDHERRGATGEVLLDDEIWDASEVVTVEMADGDRVDGLRIDLLLDRRQRGAAAVEQQRDARRAHEDAGVRAPTVRERVPAPDECDADGHPSSSR